MVRSSIYSRTPRLSRMIIIDAFPSFLDGENTHDENNPHLLNLLDLRSCTTATDNATSMLNLKMAASHPHRHAQLLEAQLMQKMDEEILQAEESDLMQRYDASIRRAEQQQEQQQQQEAKNGPKPCRTKRTVPLPLPSLPFVLSPRPASPWLVVAEQLRDAPTRRRAREDAAAFGYYDPSSVEGLEYVVATKLIPRHLGARWKTRKQLEDYFMRKFQRDQKQQQQQHQQREDPMFWKSFRLRLCSANPSAWRLHVYGYRTTVDAFLLCLAGIFGKALRKQQQEENAPLIVNQQGKDAALTG